MDDSRRLRLLEAKLMVATRAAEIITITERAASPKDAVPLIMESFGVGVEQAVTILDSPFSAVTSSVRAAVEEEIRALKAADQPG
jgi:DNA gyrase/topoisomerase IV subunit A